MERKQRRRATIGIIIFLLLLVSCDFRAEPRVQYCREQGYQTFRWSAFFSDDFYCVGPGERLVTEQEFKDWEKN